MDLERATRPVRRDQHRFELEVPDGWQQGRGAFGGLSLAALVRAIEHFAAQPERSLRSLSAQLPGPTLVGKAEIEVAPVRVSSGQSTIEARLRQDGEVRALAVAVLGGARAPGSAAFVELEPPTLRRPAETAPLPRIEGGPVFTQHFEYRTDGPFPFRAGAEAYAEGWIRARQPGSIDRSAFLVAMADAWWPASFTRAPAPFPVGTVAFTLQLIGLPEGELDRPLAHRAWVWAQGEGWFVEQRELWSEDGRLLVLNQQTFAVIK